MAKASDKSVFDVSKPGKSAPSPTSRPIITSHGPMLKDPMFSNKQTDEKPVEETPAVETSEKVIKPAGEIKPEKAESDNPDSTEDTVEVKVEQTKPPEPRKETTAEEPASDKGTDSAQSSTAKVETTASETSGDDVVNPALKPEDAGPSKEELARQQQIEGLTEAETYFLPIGQVTRRRNNRRASIVLIILFLLVVAGGYLALDAELIENTIELPFDIIK